MRTTSYSETSQHDSHLVGTLTLSYDGLDHLQGENNTCTTQGQSGPNDAFAMLPYNYSFASDGADNLTTVRGAPTPVNDDNQLTTPTYDGDGNPTTYNGSAVTFDIEDRLTANSFLTAGYYDDGTRAWKQPVNGANGYRAYFLYDGGHLVAEIEHDGTLRNLFGWSTAGLLERYQASNNISYVYTYDPSGNVVMRHDSSPSADCDYTTLYDAFGAQHGSLDPLTQTQSQQAKQDMVGYGGQWGYYTDQESVSNPTNPAVRYLWVRCGVRDYDSATARWLERDPIGYEGGINVYSFCQNNPVTKSDPTGQDVVILVYGSLGDKGSWSKESEAAVRKLLPVTAMVRFNWSAHLSVGDVKAAGEDLDALVRDLRAQYPGEPIDVLGHSNGGNVAIAASQDYRSPIDLIIRLGTPPRDDLDHAEDTTMVLDVYDPKDNVAFGLLVPVGYSHTLVREQGNWHRVRVNSPSTFWSRFPTGGQKHMNMNSSNVMRQVKKDAWLQWYLRYRARK